jgi:hypothetical protein
MFVGFSPIKPPLNHQSLAQAGSHRGASGARRVAGLGMARGTWGRGDFQHFGWETMGKSMENPWFIRLK